MKKIVTNRMGHVGWNLMMLLMLCFLFILVSFCTLGAGDSRATTEDNEISMEFHPDFFIINGKDTGFLYISFSDTDLSKVKITKDDILFKGFSASITYFDVSEYGDHVSCYISLSSISNTSGQEEKSIELREGVASIQGKNSPSLKLKVFGNFISMQQFMVLNILLSIVWNILFLIYANILYGKGLTASIFLWIGFIICGIYPFAWRIKIVNLNLDHYHTLFVLLLIVIELSFCIWVSKRTLKSSGYSLFIILLSTLTIARFSQIFSRYYLHLGQVYNFPSISTPTIDSNFNYINSFQSELSYTLYYMELSFRYFFTFPPDEYYGLVAILQFSMGKVYEVVVFGSVGSIILEHVRKKTPKI